MIKILSLLSMLVIYACSNTSPTNVKISDTQKVTSIEYGIIKSSTPVKIKGESNWIGATAGGMIGGLLGTACSRIGKLMKVTFVPFNSLTSMSPSISAG